MDAHQQAVHASLTFFTRPYTPEQVDARLDELAAELVAERWQIPGEPDLCADRATELLLDWIETEDR